jgi:V8-like Glu-specific endopeptidase
VTAGHCLVRDAAAGDYRFRTRLPERVRIFRGYSRAAGSYAYAACDVAKVWVPGRFVRSGRSDQRFGDRAYDFAVLTTRYGCRYPSNSVLRLWANEADGRQLRDGQRIRLAGYPADPRDPDMNGLSMWRSQGRIQPIADDAAHLGFTGFVAQGMSGAPVWRTFTTDSPCGRRHCVVGVVTECAVDDNGLCKLGNSTRVAVRITHKVKRAIRRH